jgi:hypothetical protein
MILVNLLPKEYRVSDKPKYSVSFRWGALAMFLCFLAVSLFNLYEYVGLRNESRSLQAQWQKIEGPSREADQLQFELGASVLSEIKFYDTFLDPPFEMALMLNLISDLIPRSLTLQNLKLSRHGHEFEVIMNGISETWSEKSKLVEIQNFANGLKDQLEEFLRPTGNDLIPAGSAKKVEAEVTTTSKDGALKGMVVTDFRATVSTGGFKKG